MIFINKITRMNNFIINESQLSLVKKQILLEEKITQSKQKWDSFSSQEQKFLKELTESLYPNNKEILTEAWWNTIGDVVGIFDPTGVVDLINGLDYIRQGDYFFGFLSMIAIIPYVGDVIAKPIMGVSKGSSAIRSVNRAMSVVKKGGSTAEASKILAEAGKSSSLISKLINTSISWGGKLKQIINKIPRGKLTGGLMKTLTDWIDLFVGVAKQSKLAGKTVTQYAKRVKAADPKTATALMKELKTGLSKSSRTFRDYKMTDPGFMSKYVWPGLSFRNRNLMALMRRTKFYAGLLDYIGVANFVGPEELSKEMGEENLRNKITEYSNTKQGQGYWQQDMSSVTPEQAPSVPSQQNVPQSGGNEDSPLSKMFKNLITGQLNPIPGM
jgi:hypothetical protein